MIFFNSNLLSAVFICFCISHAVGQSNVMDDKTKITLDNFRKDYCQYLLEGKSGQLQVYFADTVRLMPPFQKTVRSKGNAVTYYHAFLNRFTVTRCIRNEMEVLDLGTQVLETGTLNMHVTLKSTGKEYVLAGKYLDLWKRREDGEVLLLTEAWNYDQQYGAFQEQLKFEEVPAFHEALMPNVPVNSNISFELAAYNRLLDATVTQHNADTWSQYYCHDAMLMASYHPVLKGRKAIDGYLEMHVKELPVFEELDIRNDRIDDLGEFVIEYASHIASWKNGNSSGVSLGKNIRVWRRLADHSLKIFRSIGMYD